MKVELLNITPNAEKLIEEIGRTSYKSYDKITEDSYKSFLKMLLDRKHLSVFEHGIASFRITEVSRSFTHQLVRHRLASFVQESQRYVKSDFDYVIPESVKNIARIDFDYMELMEHIQFVYEEMIKTGIPKEDARFVLPNAIHTEIVITANFREWMTILNLRLSKHAQWEIRNVMKEIHKILKEKYPIIFNTTINEEEKPNKNIVAPQGK